MIRASSLSPLQAIAVKARQPIKDAFAKGLVSSFTTYPLKKARVISAKAKLGVYLLIILLLPFRTN
jgi:hypothetical protein